MKLPDLVLGHQAVEDELEDAARSLVGGDAGIEVDRRTFERDGERVVGRPARRRRRPAAESEPADEEGGEQVAQHRAHRGRA